MNYGCLIAGFILLLNPNLNVYDILPDFIGYALIMYSLRKVSDMSPSVKDADAALRKLIYIGIGRFALMFLVPLMDDIAYRLVFTFTLAAFEAGYFIVFCGKFFDGLGHLALRHDGSAVYAKESETRSMLMLFAVVKSFFNLLPELKYLSTTEYEGEITAFGTFSIAKYSLLFTVVSITAVIILGIITGFKVVRYLNGIKNDAVFNANINSFYNTEIAADTVRFFCRRVLLSSVFIIAAAVTLADLYIDGVNIIPDFIGAGFLLCAMLTVRRDFKEAGKVLKPLYIYLPFTAASWVFMLIFGLMYYRYSIYKSFESYYMFIASAAVSVIEAALFVWIMFMLCAYFRNLIDNHAGAEIDPMFKSLVEKRELMLTGLNRRLRVFRILSIATAVSSVMQTVCLMTFEEYWMIHPIVCFIWVFSAAGLTNSIIKEFKIRYGLTHM